MKFIDYIDPGTIELNVPFSSKKRLFEQLAAKIGEDDKEIRSIYDCLVLREKVGSTSLGNGVALPHGKCLEDKEVRIRIVVLNKPVNFESVDDTLVQLIVCVIFPKETEPSHHKFLKQMGKIFKKHKVFRELINTTSIKGFKEIILRESK